MIRKQASCLYRCLLNPPDHDEAALVLALAWYRYRQQWLRRRRELTTGIALTIFSLISIIIVGYLIANANWDNLYPEITIALLIFLGTLSAAGGYSAWTAWRFHVPAPTDLIRAYWRFLVLPYTPETVLLCDTIAAEGVSVAAPTVDAELLSQALVILEDHADPLMAEAALLRSLSQLRETLSTTAPMREQMAFTIRDNSFGKSIAPLLRHCVPIPAAVQRKLVELPAHIAGAPEAYVGFIDRLAHFVHGPYRQTLQTRFSETRQRTCKVLEDLEAARAEWSMRDPSGGVAPPDQTGNLETDRRISQLFAPVIENLTKDIEPTLTQLGQDTEYSINRIQSTYDGWMRSVTYRHEHDMEDLESAILEWEGKLELARRGLREAQNAPEPVLSEGADDIGQRAFQDRLRHHRETIRIGQERVNRVQIQLGKKREELARLRRSYKDQVDEYQQQRDASIQQQRQQHAQQRATLVAHISEIESARAELARLAQRERPTTPGPDVGAVVTWLRGIPTKSSAKIEPTRAIVEAVYAQRTRAISQLRDRIEQAIGGHFQHASSLENVLSAACWPAEELPAPSCEYFLPVWFVRFSERGHGIWRPWLTPGYFEPQPVSQKREIHYIIANISDQVFIKHLQQALDPTALDTRFSERTMLHTEEQRHRMNRELDRLRDAELIQRSLKQDIERHLLFADPGAG